MSTPYLVALQGFSAFERSALGAYFRLASNRSPAYEQVADLTHAAWKFFDEHNGLKVPAKGKSEDVQNSDREHGLEANPFDHRYMDAICWAGADPPTLLIRLSGYEDGHSRAGPWFCLYDVRSQKFTTDFEAYNRMNTKMKFK